ncbi:MAG: SAM-dependent methyltransferase [Bacteroidetes bacterium B1(2017)]|nr:MAG: SAM-dependent methyltransferase [Bacteroidetes bacterium B1(2017)]
MDTKKEWFAEWFDSPYYHILYGNRDMREAEFFLKNLILRFNPHEKAKIIDLACGKGRHSIYLNSLGFDVTGVDLSCHSISLAKPFENEHLHFAVSDLRSLKLDQKFDIALNLFTSFAYFDDLETDEKVLLEIKNVLNPGGFLLIDFFNAHKVISNLVEHEVKEKEGIVFTLDKKLEAGKIIKTISFSDKQQDYTFEEKVQALQISDFVYLLKKTGFQLIEVFGDYDLNNFEPLTSDRLILIAQNTYVG